MSFIKEPLFHFLIGAVLIYAYFELIPATGENQGELSEIVISKDDVLRLQESWIKSWRKAPTKEQLDDLIQNAIHEEIYYREGLKLGLDQDDAVVRNRMIQKMRFLHSEELREPTEQDLLDMLKQNPQKYQIESEFSFEQVYLGQKVGQNDQQLLNQLNQNKVTKNGIGEPLSLPSSLSNVAYSAIKRQFGESFAQSLAKVSEQSEQLWNGPIESGFGFHLVKLNTVIESRPGTLNDASIRQRVSNDWRAVKRKKLEQSIVAELRKDYSVTVVR